MNAIERTFFSEDWITLLFLLGLVFIFLLKMMRPRLLRGYFFSFFTQGFVAKRSEDKLFYWSMFHRVLFLLCIINFSILGMFLFYDATQITITNFIKVLASFAGYVLLRFFVDMILANLFRLKVFTPFFRYSKLIYLYSISLYLYPMLILYYYAFSNRLLLLVLVGFLLFFRFTLITYNNKKLILRNFLYFILYFCTLEIAPLFIYYRISEM